MGLDIQFLWYDIHGMELALKFKWVQNCKYGFIPNFPTLVLQVSGGDLFSAQVEVAPNNHITLC